MAISPSERLTVLTSEIQSLRSELVEMEKSTHRALITFLGVAAGAAAVAADPARWIIPQVRLDLAFLITQAEFVLALFALALVANLSTHAGYIAALEQQVNGLIGVHTVFWDSYISPRFIFGGRGGFDWSIRGLVLFFAALYLAMALEFMWMTDSKALSILVCVEFVGGLCLAEIVTRQRGAALSAARDLVGTPFPPPTSPPGPGA